MIPTLRSPKPPPPASSDSWPTEVPKFPPVQTRTRDTKRQGEGKEEGMFRTLPDPRKGLLLHFGKSVLSKKTKCRYLAVGAKGSSLGESRLL